MINAGTVLAIIGMFVIIAMIIATVLILRPVNDSSFRFPKKKEEDWFDEWLDKHLTITTSKSFGEKNKDYLNGYEDCYNSIILYYGRHHPSLRLSVKLKEEDE